MSGRIRVHYFFNLTFYLFFPLQELPEKLGGCRQLQVLKLDDNALTHLPESIGGLAALQELVVTQNDLETLPASMGLLRNLHTLHLDDNLLTGGSCYLLFFLCYVLS